jgi:hypothetical protein
MYWRIHDLWGSANLVASTVTELDDILPRLMDTNWDSVWATHGCPSRLSCGRLSLGRGRTQPDSLIVIVEGGHSWCPRGSRVSCCQVIFLARCILIQISMTPSYMGEACSLCSNVVMELHYCWYENYGWCWQLCSQGMIIINYYLCYFCMLNICCKLFMVINLTWLITYLKVISK